MSVFNLLKSCYLRFKIANKYGEKVSGLLGGANSKSNFVRSPSYFLFVALWPELF